MTHREADEFAGHIIRHLSLCCRGWFWKWARPNAASIALGLANEVSIFDESRDWGFSFLRVGLIL